MIVWTKLTESSFFHHDNNGPHNTITTRRQMQKTPQTLNKEWFGKVNVLVCLFIIMKRFLKLKLSFHIRAVNGFYR